MTDFRASAHAVPIDSIDQLVDEFHQAGKSRDRWAIGTEYEKVVVDAATGRAVPFDGPRGVERLLVQLAERFGWEPRDEEGRVIALSRDGISITLEPGGQIEFAGPPHRSLHETHRDVETHVRELVAVASAQDQVVLGLGCHPLSPLDDIPWVPKQRYRIMREYMMRVGTLGHRMMKQTATVQANLDFADERDAMRKLRIGMASAPIMNALFANSPLVDGDASGFVSFRGQVWTDTDRARCGMLPFVFRPDAGFADYVAWALDVPMYFVLRDGRYVTDVTGVPFRHLLEGRMPGLVATMDDWNLHLTTLFPEVRLKGFIELRAADSQPPDRVVALPALAKGIFYDADCQDAAFDLVRNWSFDQCVEAYRDGIRGGFAARLRGIRLGELARELLAIAFEGLRRATQLDDAGRDERRYLDPIAEQLARGRTLADEVVGLWNGPWNRQPGPLLRHCALS